MTDDQTDSPLRTVARRVQALRKARGWSAEKLAQEITALGVPWDRQVVTKLENGRRQVLSFTELHALAEALDTPPILLLFPVGVEEAVPVLPGKTVDTWTAAKWFMGKGRLDDDPAGVEALGAAITLRERHDALVDDYEYALVERDLWPPTVTDPEKKEVHLRVHLGLRDLRAVRAEMRRHGFIVPHLDEPLRHVDDRRHVNLTPEQAEAYAAANPGDLELVDYSEAGRHRKYKSGDAARIQAAIEYARTFQSDGDEQPDDRDDSHAGTS